MVCHPSFSAFFLLNKTYSLELAAHASYPMLLRYSPHSSGVGLYSLWASLSNWWKRSWRWYRQTRRTLRRGTHRHVNTHVTIRHVSKVNAPGGQDRDRCRAVAWPCSSRVESKRFGSKAWKAKFGKQRFESKVLKTKFWKQRFKKQFFARNFSKAQFWKQCFESNVLRAKVLKQRFGNRASKAKLSKPNFDSKFSRAIF